MIPKSIAPSQVSQLAKMRWMGRTNLHFLCTNILGYKDIELGVHGPLLKVVQQFPLPPAAVIKKIDIVQPGLTEYTPWQDRSKLEGKRRMLMLDPRSGLKCLQVIDNIGLSDGSYKKANELKIGDILWGINDKDFTPKHTKVTGIEKQAPQECFKITFRSGRELNVSHNHPLRVIDGWIEAKNLEVGDKIGILNYRPVIGGKYLPEAEFLGWMMGDGCYLNTSFTNHTEDFRDKFKNSVVRAGGTVSTRPSEKFCDIHFNGLAPLLRNYKLTNSKSGDKFVPVEIFTANDKSVKEFLYGYFMSDGTLQYKGVSWTSKSKRLADDIRRLLGRFGIISRVKTVTLKSGPYKGNVYYYGYISGKTNVEAFLAIVPWDKPHNYVKTIFNNPNLDVVPHGWRDSYDYYFFRRGERPKWLSDKWNRKGRSSVSSASKYGGKKEYIHDLGIALNDEKLKNLGSNKIFWDDIVSIEATGLHETWAIETETENYCIDDVITHNTTINAISHTIQWLLNYPQFALLIVQSNSEKVHEIIKEIKYHFQYNQIFRDVYPDYCPSGRRVADWGNRDGFTLPNRIGVCRRLGVVAHKEDSVTGSSIDKGSAGRHYEVVKFSDIVEPATTKTREQIQSTIYQFGMAENLLVKPDDWIDVEGTRYSYGDLYNKIIDNWEIENNAGKDPKWKIHVRGCYLRDIETPAFTPDELKLPFKKTENNEFISWWPERWTVELLEADRKDPVKGEAMFACQKLNDPLAADDGSQAFPVNDDYPKWITRENFVKVPISYRTITIDTADTTNMNSNASVLTVAAWDQHGRCYVEHIDRGKYLPDEIVARIFQLNKKYKPLNIIIEETAFVRGFKSSIMRRSNLENTYLPMSFVKRENTASKQERIKNTLQPWYKSGQLRFLDDIGPRHELLQELSRFPKYDQDDILDTLADLFQNKEWFGREVPRPDTPDQFDALYESDQATAVRNWTKLHPAYFNRWLNIDTPSEVSSNQPTYSEYEAKTGGL